MRDSPELMTRKRFQIPAATTMPNTSCHNPVKREKRSLLRIDMPKLPAASPRPTAWNEAR